MLAVNELDFRLYDNSADQLLGLPWLLSNVSGTAEFQKYGAQYIIQNIILLHKNESVR